MHIFEHNRPGRVCKVINYPIFCSLSHERVLVPTGAGITLDGMSASPNEIIKLREFDYKGVPVIFIERSFFKIFLYEGCFEWDVGLFLMKYMRSDWKRQTSGEGFTSCFCVKGQSREVISRSQDGLP